MTNRLFVLFGLMTCAGAATAAPLVDGDAEAGKARAAACAGCHGPQGNMESDQFPKLAGQGAPYLYEQLKLFKSGERENAIMAGQAAGLSDTDMKDLAAYFASQQTKPGAADVAVAPAGATIYHGGNAAKGVPACSGCHGPSGLGNAAAKFPRLSGQSPQYIATQLKAYRDGSRSGYRNATIMAGVAENLDDDDIKALASYVAGLAPAGKEQAQGDQYGALMQNAADSQPAGDSGKTDASPSAVQSSDDESDQADAAAKEETDRAGGGDEAQGNETANKPQGSDSAASSGTDDTSGDAATNDKSSGQREPSDAQSNARNNDENAQ